jgi:glyoxylase-like metal-dependent hydrolase (beta-lactamase superfamily II)
MKDPDLAVGGVTVHRVIDIDPQVFVGGALLPGCDATVIAELAAVLGPGHGDAARGELHLAMQSHLLRVGGRTILVDTCVGEHKPRPRRPSWDAREGTAYLANLAAAGCGPEDIDIVLCTHLHVDHVGWNTRREDGRWVPTFPRARYVVAQAELDFAAREAAADPQFSHGSFQDSVLPIVEAGLCDPRRPGETIAEGATLVPLPGHTPGQTGLDVMTGAGPSLLFCGDAIHSPVQVLRPNLSSAFCCDAGEAVRTRTGLLERAASGDVVLVPAHLRGAGMRIRRRDGGFVPVLCGCDGAALA